MIRNLKLFMVALLAFGCLGIAAAPSAAAFDLFNDTCSGNPDATVCKDSNTGDNPLYGSGSVVELVVNILALIIGVAAVVIIIVAGIQYMLSTGDPTKVNNAKNAILYAAVGLVIAVLARFVVPFILGKL